MHRNRAVLEAELERFGLPECCNHPQCTACEQFKSFLNSDDDRDSDMIKDWDLLLKIYSSSECGACNRFQFLTKGSIVSITYCLECYMSTKSFEVAGTVTVHPINGYVDIDTFEFPQETSSPRTENCNIHRETPKVFTKCFGEVPFLAVLRTSKKVSNRHRHFMPFSVSLGSNGIPVTGIDVKQTFLESGLFVPNPCYNQTWIDFVAEAVHSHRDNCGRRQYLVRTNRKKTPVDDGQWSLQDVASGTPFRTKTGVWKVLDTITCSSNLEYQKINLYPPHFRKGQLSRVTSSPQLQSQDNQTDKDNLARSHAHVEEEGHIRDDEQNVIDVIDVDTMTDVLPPVIIDISDEEELDDTLEDDVRYDEEGQEKEDNVKEENEVNEEDESIDSEERFKNEDEKEETDLVESDENLRDTSVPFLFASYQQLLNSVRNRHYEIGQANAQGLAISEAVKLVEEGDLRIFETGRAASVSSHKIRYGKEAVLSTEGPSIRLRLICDIDSFDAVTFPFIGNAFARSPAKVYLHFQPGYVERTRYMAKNNNLCDLPPARSNIYPGTYFLDVSMTRFRQNQHRHYDDAFALKVLEVGSSLSLNALVVRALVPSGVVHIAREGEEALLKLFSRFVTSTGGNSSDTHSVKYHHFFWYIITEFLLMMSSSVVQSGRLPNTTSRLPCCAIPNLANLQNHDRQCGGSSSFNDGCRLDEWELTLTCLLAVRFLGALEVFADVPPSKRIHTHDPRYHDCPRHLKSLVEDSAVWNVLMCQVGSSETVQFFFESDWLRRTGDIGGGLIRMQSDSERRESNALPSDESNEGALMQGHMVLEDLLLLCPILFRCTVHGLKRGIHSEADIKRLKRSLGSEFRLRAFQDGIVDVGYNICAPVGDALAVNLAMSTARSKLLVPRRVSGLSFFDLGASLYSATGYPDFGGFTTPKGQLSNRRSVLVPGGVRRVKAYSTKRRVEATRGKTVYDTSGVALQKGFRDVSNNVLRWHGLRTTSFAKVQTESQKHESKLDKYFQTILHDIERRKHFMLKSQDSIGVRVELTSALGTDWAPLDEAARLMKLQEDACRLSDNELEKQVQSGDFPWWLSIPRTRVSQEASNSGLQFIPGGELVPVTLVESDVFVRLQVGIETYLVKSAFDLYRQQRAHTSMDNMPSPIRPWEILTDVNRMLPQGRAATVCLIACRGLLHAAQNIVDSQTCKFRDASLQMCPYVMSATGVDMTWYSQGIPQILMARILALEPSFERGLQRYTPTSVVLRNLKGAPDMLDVAAQMDTKFNSPKSMMFAIRRRKTGFYNAVLAGPPSEIDAEVVAAKRGQPWHSVIATLVENAAEAVDDEDNCEFGFQESLFGLGGLIAQLLVSDVCVELDLMLNHNMQSDRDQYHHHQRMYPKKKWRVAVALGQRTERSEEWPLCARLNWPKGTQSGFKALRERLISFYASGTGKGFSPIDNQIVNSSPLASEDGTMKMQNFIGFLWEQAGLLPHFPNLVFQAVVSRGDNKGVKSHKWRSIQALRIAEDLVHIEEERWKRNRSRNNIDVGDGEEDGEHFKLRLEFETEFPMILAQCFTSAGLTEICPLVRDSIPNSDGSQCRVWGPTPIFTYLTHNEEELELLQRDSNNDSPELQRRVVRGSKLTSLVSFLQKFKVLFEKVQEDITLFSQTKRTREERKAREKWIRLSKKFWAEHRVEDLIDEFLVRVREKHSLEFSPAGYDWTVMLVNYLVGVRRQFGDEGAGAFWVKNGTKRVLVPIRRNPGQFEARLVRVEDNTYKDALAALKEPWPRANLGCLDGYPMSDRTRQGTKTKKVKVRVTGDLLTHSRLAFKCDGSNLKAGIPLEMIRDSFVEDVFEDYRDIVQSSARASHAMWRLSPNILIISQLLAYCSEVM